MGESMSQREQDEKNERLLRLIMYGLFLFIRVAITLLSAQSFEKRMQEMIAKESREAIHFEIDGGDFGPLFELFRGFGYSVKRGAARADAIWGVLLAVVCIYIFYRILFLRKGTVIRRGEIRYVFLISLIEVGFMVFQGWRTAGHYGYQIIPACAYIIGAAVLFFLLRFRWLRLMTEVAERKAMKQESGEEPETDVSGEEPVN